MISEWFSVTRWCHSLVTLCAFSKCSLSVLWVLSKCALGFLWVWVFLGVLSVFSEYSLGVLWVLHPICQHGQMMITHCQIPFFPISPNTNTNIPPAKTILKSGRRNTLSNSWHIKLTTFEKYSKGKVLDLSTGTDDDHALPGLLLSYFPFSSWSERSDGWVPLSAQSAISSVVCNSSIADSISITTTVFITLFLSL